jgi:hypothetical protein
MFAARPDPHDDSSRRFWRRWEVQREENPMKRIAYRIASLGGGLVAMIVVGGAAFGRG